MKKSSVIAMGNRIRLIRGKLGMSQREFATACKMSPNYMSEIETGKFRPGFEFLKNVVNYHNVNFDYLVNGKGPMFRNTETEETSKPTEPTNSQPAKHEEIPGKYPMDDDVEEMLWYFKHASVVKYAMLEYFKKYLFQNKEMIEEELEKQKEKRNKKTETQTSNSN